MFVSKTCLNGFSPTLQKAAVSVLTWIDLFVYLQWPGVLCGYNTTRPTNMRLPFCVCYPHIWAKVFSLPFQKDDGAIAAFLALQKSAIFSQGDRHCFLYQWFCEHFRYTGIASNFRGSSQACSGLVQRYLEHLLGTVRPHVSGSSKFRYRLARRFSPSTFGFLAICLGEKAWIQAVEWHDIVTTRPNANGFRPRRRVKNTVRFRPFPEQRCMAEGQDSKGHQDLLQYRLNRLEASFSSRAICNNAPRQHSHILLMPFGRAYAWRLRQLFALHATFGPLNIYAREESDLLALWFACRSPAVSWPSLQRSWNMPFLLPALNSLRLKLPKQGQRGMFTRRIRAYLHWKGLPTSKLRFSALDAPSVGFVKRMVYKVLDGAQGWSAAEKRWLKSQVCVTQGRRLTFKNSWNHQKVAEGAHLEQIRSAPRRVLSQILNGTGFLRPSKNWDVARRFSLCERKSRVTAAIRSGFADAGVNMRFLPSIPDVVDVHASSHAAFLIEAQRLQQTDHVYKSYTKDLEHHLKRSAVVPDDKSKRTAWVMSRFAYQVLCLVFVVFSSSWSFVSFSRRTANELLLERMKSVLPRHVADQLGLLSNPWVLPYCYVTIKEKCWWNGTLAARVCSKWGHSCVRKICAYAAWPKKHAWRLYNKSLVFLSKTFAPGFATWGLFDASHRLFTGIRKLSRPRSSVPRCCIRCHGSCPGLNVIVADAGQFFEEVKSETACRAACSLVLQAKQKGWRTVGLCRKKKTKPFLSTASSALRGRIRFLEIDDIFQVFVSAMSVSMVSIGHAVASMTGLPIGGLLSQAAASTVLGREEEVWLRSHHYRRLQGYQSVQNDWACTCLQLRYVDDVIFASYVFCRGCLIDMIPLIYVEKFDVSPESDEQCWLDMVIDLTTGLIRPKAFSITLPPQWGVQRQFLRPIVINVIARTLATSFNTTLAHVHLSSWLLNVLKAGWSLRAVSSALHTIHKKPFAPTLRFLKRLIRSPSFKELL